MLKLDLEYESEILFIRLSGNLNKYWTYKINNYIIPVIKKHKINTIVLNLNNLKSIDSSGINAIINLKSIVKCIKGKLYLCECDNYLNKCLKTLRIKPLSSEKILLS